MWIEFIEKFDYEALEGTVTFGPGVRMRIGSGNGYINIEGYLVLSHVSMTDIRVPPHHFKIIDADDTEIPFPVTEKNTETP